MTISDDDQLIIGQYILQRRQLRRATASLDLGGDGPRNLQGLGTSAATSDPVLSRSMMKFPATIATSVSRSSNDPTPSPTPPAPGPTFAPRPN